MSIRFKKAALVVICIGAAALLMALLMSRETTWSGVDETVVEEFASRAGREAQPPLINTDQGDILLFVFLLAGVAGGFVLGYYFRVLFPPPRKDEST